ncbi:prepilin-type N-terminal cleavage/methylation domain-containing protein [Patescibacteria group bacterium]|nr:prepilin-type N-terminal cleavage/methylation domain-containing protein [Patescibacteria group bacterium]
MRKQFTINNLQLTNKGFTLIELIIYIAIVSIILVSITYLILDVLGSQTKSYAHLEIEQNLRFIKQTMSADVKSAQDINTLTATSLILENGVDDITYTFDTVENKITRQVGSLPAEDITTNEVVVIGNFSNLSYLSRSRNIRVHLDITYLNPSDLADYRANLIADLTLTLRGRR